MYGGLEVTLKSKMIEISYQLIISKRIYFHFNVSILIFILILNEYFHIILIFILIVISSCPYKLTCSSKDFTTENSIKNCKCQEK